MKKGQDQNRTELSIYGFTRNNYVELFVELALNRFNYINTPPGIDTRFLELRLLKDGNAICFKNDNKGPFSLNRFEYLSLGLSGGYRIDSYGELINRQAIATGTSSFVYTDLTPENSIIFYNNKLRSSSYPMINWYANRMYDATLSADNNIDMQKFPVIAKAPNKLQLAFKNAISSWMMGTPFIFSDKDSIALKDFECLNLNIPFVADKMFSYNEALWNQCLTRLGIDNMSISEKKERMISGEIESQKASINLYKEAFLSERKKGVEKFNEMFGTNWQVEWNEEVNLNGNLHNKVTEPFKNTGL